jgi:hypothetical protein
VLCRGPSGKEDTHAHKGSRHGREDDSRIRYRETKIKADEEFVSTTELYSLHDSDLMRVMGGRY